MSEPKVLHEWELAGYHGRIVEVEPGIVTSEQAMDDDKLGRLWLSNRSPFGWQNEMIHLALANDALAARHRELVEDRDAVREVSIAVQAERDRLIEEVASLRTSLSRVTAERDEAIAKVQFMVNRAADEKLDGYRELGARAAAAENDRDEVLCLLDEAIECASRIETSEPDEAWGCWLRDLRARVAARKGA